MPGPTLGRYRLAARVAQGGMGEVYRGVDVGFAGIERPVAVKVIAPALAVDPGVKQQFVDEAKLSYLLCHQNVVQVRDVGEIDGQFFIAMEWVDGADLGTILARLKSAAGQPLPLRFACLVAVEAARGLDYAHRFADASGQPLHLVHRDVSPSNLLVSFEGEIKVSDFGIARSRLRVVTSMPGGLKGKIGYMAPEQARAEMLDARADVFALGAVLFEMVTGQNAFTYNAKENEALERVRNGRVPALRTLAPTVPQGLEAIVMRAMAPAREDRYQSCAQMREDLESFARRESYTLSPSDFGQFVRDLMDVPAPAAAEKQKTATPVKRLSGSRAVATPRAFNDALGGALAALGGDGGSDGDGDGDGVGLALAATEENREVAAATAPGRVRPRTVALHQPVQVNAAIEPPRVPTDMTDLIPRSSSRVPLLVAVAAFAVAGVAGGVWFALRKEAPPAGENSVAAPAAIVPAPPPSLARSGAATTTAAAAPATVPPLLDRRPDKHHARTAAAARPAHLTVTSDVKADVFVDGSFVRATPIVDLEIAPGRHTVRVESAAAGLRLIPRQQTVDVKPGELRELRMDLK
ncbi:MAG: serine/threonine protein kinase [Myxococcales bacterium]|nr:serine/threonine protein kinase [Myxococcales bacterium]